MNKGPNINLSFSQLTNLLSEMKTFLIRYKVVLFIVCNLTLFGFLVWKIGELNSITPDQAGVEETLNKNGNLKIDQDAVKKIEQLKDQNVQVQALFKTARDNPFQE